jgi:hypothetical protein
VETVRLACKQFPLLSLVGGDESITNAQSVRLNRGRCGAGGARGEVRGAATADARLVRVTRCGRSDARASPWSIRCCARLSRPGKFGLSSCLFSPASTVRSFYFRRRARARMARASNATRRRRLCQDRPRCHDARTRALSHALSENAGHCLLRMASVNCVKFRKPADNSASSFHL